MEFSFGTLPITVNVVPDYVESYYSVNVESRQENAPCPLGSICNETHQASCHEIQQVAIETFEFGDIHGGAYCPEGGTFYQNCPAGSSCPDPVSLKTVAFIELERKEIELINSFLFLSSQPSSHVRQGCFAQ